MEKFIIHGGKQLHGELKITSSKNACLPILAASILTDENIIIKNIPKFLDIENMCEILRAVGSEIKIVNGDCLIKNNYLHNYNLPENLTLKLRSSIFMLGSLLSTFKKAKVAYPGGCNIGNRPIDLHLKGLQDLNVKIVEEHGYINCDGSEMKNGTVHLDFPSVGATENIMMASVKLKGKTTIINAAKEPEIIDLQNFINSMGGNIKGAGTGIIEIEGVDKLHNASFVPMGDRIIAGTYLIAVALTGGQVKFTNVNADYLSSLIFKLQKSGCEVQIDKNSITISSNANLTADEHTETMPYPGFPTDLQSQFVVLNCLAKGSSVMVENVFEGRYNYIPELIKMGAKIMVKDRVAFINGDESLSGAEVFAPDLRAGAALTIAGLCAKGYTTINNVEHIDRGYQNMEKELESLGADIKRVVE